MRIAWTKRLIGKGAFAPSPEWTAIRDSLHKAIKGVEWPAGAGSFSINPDRKANGVIPIKARVAELLKAEGWLTEQKWPIPDIASPGRMDGAHMSSQGLIAFEWETGNVASSHRSLNKICLGLTLGTIAGGVMAISTRALARCLTDRVGSAEEIQAYFPLWQHTPCQSGVLEIIAVEHDALDPNIPPIPKSISGRNLRP